MLRKGVWGLALEILETLKMNLGPLSVYNHSKYNALNCAVN